MNRDKLNQWINKMLSTSGWTITKLASEANVDQSTLSKVLNGRRQPKLDYYIKIADALGGEVAVVEMLQVAELMPTEEALKGSLLELFKVVNRLTLEGQKEAEDYLRFLIERDKQRSIEASDSSNLAHDGG